MRLLHWECSCAILAFVLTGVFILVPGPYPMAVFTFIAQPLFAIAAIGYLVKVVQDLRRRTSYARQERPAEVHTSTAASSRTI